MKGHAKHARTPSAPAPVARPKPPQPQEVPVVAARNPPKLWPLLTASAFFLVYGLCLWKWVNVGLIYHGGGHVRDFPSFYWGWDFAREFRTHPGGLMEYGSALLGQSLYSSGFGALVLTLEAALTYAGVVGCMRAFKANGLGLLGFIPPALLLEIYCNYRHYFVPVASFTAGVALAWGWLELRSRWPRWHLGSAFAVVACLYGAAPSAVIVFLSVAALYELRSRTSWLKLLPWLCLSGVVPWLEGAVLFGFAPSEAYARLLPLAVDALVWRTPVARIAALLFLLPLLFCLVALSWNAVYARRNKDSQANPARSKAADTPVAQRTGSLPEKDGKEPGSKPPVASWSWGRAALALVPVATVCLALNRQEKAFILVDSLAWHGRWSEVAAAAKDNPRNAFVACTVAQASYHTGTLKHELPLLTSPQDLMLFNDKQQSHWRKSDLYLDLGYVNMALHHLTESVEFYGERPVLLQRLALVNLALGNLSTAKVYLGTLARAPFQGRWARGYLERLAIDPTLAADQEIGRLRRLMVKRDSVLALSPEEELQMLLGANHQNRMAFEYLMTYYLLTKNLNAFVKNIPRIRDFPGFEIPTLWDEALLLAGRQSGRPIEIPGHTISQEAQARVAAVARMIEQHGENGELSRRELSSDYAQTYTFYWCFHL